MEWMDTTVPRHMCAVCVCVRFTTPKKVKQRRTKAWTGSTKARQSLLLLRLLLRLALRRRSKRGASKERLTHKAHTPRMGQLSLAMAKGGRAFLPVCLPVCPNLSIQCNASNRPHPIQFSPLTRIRKRQARAPPCLTDRRLRLQQQQPPQQGSCSLRRRRAAATMADDGGGWPPASRCW